MAYLELEKWNEAEEESRQLRAVSEMCPGIPSFVFSSLDTHPVVKSIPCKTNRGKQPYSFQQMEVSFFQKSLLFPGCSRETTRNTDKSIGDPSPKKTGHMCHGLLRLVPLLGVTEKMVTLARPPPDGTFFNVYINSRYSAPSSEPRMDERDGHPGKDPDHIH